MTKRERDLLALRHMEIDAELTAIEEGRVVDGDPAEVEAALLRSRTRLSSRWAPSGLRGEMQARIRKGGL
jgi:hypothetical protein